MSKFSPRSHDAESSDEEGSGFSPQPRESANLHRATFEGGRESLAANKRVTIKSMRFNDVTVGALRNNDVNLEQDSKAEKALRAISMRIPMSAGSPEKNIADIAGSDSDTSPFNSPRKDGSSTPKNVKGKVIDQDHEQYALTYGMMLGIRVMTARVDDEIRADHTARIAAGEKEDDLESELTEDDYSYGLELEFPPGGSTNAVTTRFISRKNVDTAEKVNGGTPTPPHKLPRPFKFKDFMPKCFRAIRGLSGIDEGDFLESVAGDFNYIEFIANSKSGQFFFYSHDGKYMIKTQSHEESKLLRKIMPDYLQHLTNYPNSTIVRFYGMYRVKMDYLNACIYFVIMSSVFDTEKPIHEKYDLKGSTVGRIVKEEEMKPGVVLKDMNLMHSGRKFYFGRHNIEIFRSTLEVDSKFLARLNIMDYSLLVGIHEMDSQKAGTRHSSVVKSQRFNLNIVGNSRKAGGSYKDDLAQLGITQSPSVFQSYCGGIKSTREKNEIYFIGIIDILQLYNAGKRAETVFKSIQEDATGISSVHPTFYASRFFDFMMSHSDYLDVAAMLTLENDMREADQTRALNDYVAEGGDERMFKRVMAL
jgi:1-phosphatidylinositol-4-phosphate 5-kinase